MLKKILVALDGSDNAARALEWVKRIAFREKARMILLRVASLEEFGKDYVHVELRYAHDYLERVAGELEAEGVACKVVARVGDPARVIVATAEREGCDLILMTTRGGSKIKRWAIGGVAEKVLRLSAIPVLVLRSRTILRRTAKVRRVIVPVDGSKLAEASLAWAARLAKVLKAKMVFLHVYPTGPVGLRTWHQQRFEAIDRRMSQLCLELRKKGQAAAFNVQSGDAAHRILEFAEDDDLIVTTTHGAGGFQKWVFGSVAEKLIHDAPVPVLVYKARAQALTSSA